MALIKTEKKLALSSFLSQGAIVIFNFTLVYYLRECGIDSVGIGIASSIYPTLYFLGCIFMPKVLPQLNGKTRILIADIGMALTGVILTLLRNEALIMLDLVFYGLFQSLLWTNMETWITGGKEGGELTSRLTLFNFSWSFSVGLATSFSGFVYIVRIFERVVEVSMDIICSLHESISIFCDYKFFVCWYDEDLYRRIVCADDCLCVSAV